MNHATTATAHTRNGPDFKPRSRTALTRLEKIIATFVTWQNRETQRHHLRSIDNRLLADMGITRAEAEHESRKPFWQA